MAHYVIKSWKPNGDFAFIAIDQNSGGYPYEVENVFQAKVWNLPSEKEALIRYYKMFTNDSNDGNDWRVCIVYATTEPRNIDTL